MFKSDRQHSFEKLQHLKSLVNSNGLTFNQQLSLTSELVQHGFKNADRLIENLKVKAPNPDALDFLNRLLKQYHFIESIPNVEHFQKQPQLISKLYSKNGFSFFRGSQNPDKMVVVFTTMFNNFHISNLLMLAFLSQFGVSILMLKDATRFNYLKGVSGFGDNPEEVAEQILAIKKKNDVKKVFITGYSSGGFASLLCALLVQSDGYLGFSILSDTSGLPELTPGKYFNQEIRSKIEDKWLINLREFIDNNTASLIKKYNIYYGLNSKHDFDHAMNLDGLRQISLNPIQNCGHVTIARLMERFELTSIFHRLIFNSD